VKPDSDAFGLVLDRVVVWFGVSERTVWKWWAGARLNVHEACLVGASGCAGGGEFCWYEFKEGWCYAWLGEYLSDLMHQENVKSLNLS
jgi:hypothetical protein